MNLNDFVDCVLLIDSIGLVLEFAESLQHMNKSVEHCAFNIIMGNAHTLKCAHIPRERSNWCVAKILQTPVPYSHRYYKLHGYETPPCTDVWAGMMIASGIAV